MSTCSTSIDHKRLAVIGCGAKGVALAVHVAALKRAGHKNPPEIRIFEQSKIGAMWVSGGGFSDGIQSICTSPEHDLGFPYQTAPDLNSGRTAEELSESRLHEFRESPELFPGLPRTVSSYFSFKAFMQSGSDDGLEYGRWLAAGRPNFTHKKFAEYLNWAFDQATQQGELGDVRVSDEILQITYSDECWHLVGRDRIHGPFDGVVITGSGQRGDPLRTDLLEADDEERYVSNAQFWSVDGQRKLGSILQECGRLGEPLRHDDFRIAIVGGGGAGAAVARRILQLTPYAYVTIIGSEAALHTRTKFGFELLPYVDIEVWRQIPEDQRRKFLRRLSAAVVWQELSEQIIESGQVTYLCGRASSVVSAGNNRLAVSSELEPKVNSSSLGDFSLVIDARGLDPFQRVIDLLAMPLRTAFEECGNPVGENGRRGLTVEPTRTFEAIGFLEQYPGLHVPDLCALADPAAPNLLALGRVAISILRPYTE